MNRELNWIIPALAIVAMEYCFAFAIGFNAGFKYALPTAAYALLTSVIAASILVLILIARLATYAIAREQHPTRRLWADALFHAPWLVSVGCAFILVGLQLAALTWLKVMLPIAKGFWADPLLAVFEATLLGRDAWTITHGLFGGATAVIDRLYVTWMPIKFTTLVLLILAPISLDRARSLLSYFFIMAAGSLGQYLLPSGGPVFYERLGFGSHFRALPIEPWVATTRDYLWADYLHPYGAIGGGISAMPSLHVAIALWVALTLRAYSRRFQWLGWAWFAAILIGSIQLGWHYALDGIAASLITGIAWWVAKQIVSSEILMPRSTFRSAPESVHS